MIKKVGGGMFFWNKGGTMRIVLVWFFSYGTT